MKSLRLFALAAVALIALQAQTVRADPTVIPFGGGWQRFYWDDVPGPIDDPEDGYVLTTSQATYLDITDAFLPGDSFDLIINGTIFNTPSVPMGFTSVSNPDLAFGNTAFSWVRFTLSPGIYHIVISLREGFSSGSGFIRADVVPEPATMFLLGTGLAGVAAAARKRRKVHLSSKKGS